MIVVDVGNTNVEFGWLKGAEIIKTKKYDTAKITKTAIKKIIGNKVVVVCSVVPRVTKLFAQLGDNVYIVGRDIKVPIKCFYDKKKVGMDRLVCAYAVNVFYPESRIVLDFGTAITVDFLSARGDYQGGFILPGLGSTLKVLSSCAMLPNKINIKPGNNKIPTDTDESIGRGMVEGFSSMVNSFIAKYQKSQKIAKTTKIIVTGGDGEVVLKALEFPYEYEPDLVLKGLIILAGEYAL